MFPNLENRFSIADFNPAYICALCLIDEMRAHIRALEPLYRRH
jgi:hypothetical protein